MLLKLVGLTILKMALKIKRFKILGNTSSRQKKVEGFSKASKIPTWVIVLFDDNDDLSI